MDSLKDAVQSLIDFYDPDPTREGLVETPERYLRFLEEFTHPPEVKYTTFDAEGMDQMIVQRDIPFYSLCEHHLVPFHGVGHIAYIPNTRIVGLSKLARTLEFYSRSFQNQERITQQVADRLWDELSPKGVGVILQAEHLCMSMRGVRKPGSLTITSAVRGVFTEGDARNEFLNLTR